MSGWVIYNTACFLADGIGNLSFTRQQQYNTTLFQYVLLFTFIAVIVSSLIHFYFTKKLIEPIKKLIESTKVLKRGSYPEQLNIDSDDEIGNLITHYNELINQLQTNEKQRKKLVDDLSHELRTPIANISGYLHALQSEKIKGTPELYAALHDQSQQLANLMEQLSELNELELGANQFKKEDLQISHIIHEVVHMFSWKIKQEQLVISIEVEDAMLHADKKGIQQIMNNLIDNAIRYQNGSDPILIKGTLLKDKYEIAVSNKGEPITEKDQKQLFDRLFRVESSRNRKTGGTGLGLAIVKEIVEHHDGKISVQSDGSLNTFIIHLPVKKSNKD